MLIVTYVLGAGTGRQPEHGRHWFRIQALGEQHFEADSHREHQSAGADAIADQTTAHRLLNVSGEATNFNRIHGEAGNFVNHPVQWPAIFHKTIGAHLTGSLFRCACVCFVFVYFF